MQCESFYWRSHHGLLAIISCSANMVSKRVIFGAFLFLPQSNFLYFGCVFNKTIIPFTRVGYEIGYSQLISNTRSWNNCYQPLVRMIVGFTLVQFIRKPGNSLFCIFSWSNPYPPGQIYSLFRSLQATKCHHSNTHFQLLPYLKH